jgi:hypothetical protein
MAKVKFIKGKDIEGEYFALDILQEYGLSERIMLTKKEALELLAQLTEKLK